MKAIDELEFDIKAFCVEIEHRFGNHPECKVTVLVRTPWLADGGVVITNDETEAAITELRRLAAKESRP